MDARCGEMRRVHGDRKIASRDQLAARRRRYTLDAGDDRLWQLHDARHHPTACVKKLVVEFWCAVRDELTHVVAGAKSGAIGRKYDGAHRRILSNTVKLILDCGNHRA